MGAISAIDTDGEFAKPFSNLTHKFFATYKNSLTGDFYTIFKIRSK